MSQFPTRAHYRVKDRISNEVLIQLTREADKVYVEVQDHGRGISPERLAEIQDQRTGGCPTPSHPAGHPRTDGCLNSRSPACAQSLWFFVQPESRCSRFSKDTNNIYI